MYWLDNKYNWYFIYMYIYTYIYIKELIILIV